MFGLDDSRAVLKTCRSGDELAAPPERDTKVGREWIAGDVSRETSPAVYEVFGSARQFKKEKNPHMALL